MNETTFKIFILIYGGIFLCYGVMAYIDAGISTGNYGLFGIPLGLGLLLGIIVSSILDKFAKREKDE